ncbi:MAG: hypothetical protein FWF02_00190 [Micrococcales bacterium]|nr:hypothetical protein [Micrococcales bacterium]MCL2666118.1 hypothetical protein [Micrococcales bacterium]
MGIGPLAKKLDVDRDLLKEQAAQAALAARGAAANAYGWTTPRVEALVEWLTPRVEHLYAEGVKAAAPQVERAAGRAAPVVGTAHDKIVGDLLPKLVAAVNSAADRAQAAELEAARLAEAAQKKSHTARKVLIGAALVAGGAAAAALWARSRNQVDPWAEPWEPTDKAGLEDKVGDAADAVGEAAGSAVAKSREATRKAGEILAEAREEISDKIEEISDKAKDATKKVARRAKAEPVAADDQPVVPDNPAPRPSPRPRAKPADSGAPDPEQ